MKIAVDVDSVLCESIPSLLKRVNEKYGINLSKSTVRSYDFSIGETTLARSIAECFEDDMFVESLPVVRGAKDSIRRLRKNHKVVIATTRHEDTRGATRRWVQRHFGDIPIQHCLRDKNAVDAEVLVDDAPHTIKSWVAQSFKRIGLLFDQPWNQDFLSDPHDFRRIRVLDWPDVVWWITALDIGGGFHHD